MSVTYSTLVGGIIRFPTVLNLSTLLLQSFIVVTDVLAVAIIITMAIGKISVPMFANGSADSKFPGNRNEWLHNLPGQLVREPRFERTLGPFWMYLSAISLHITVAANMCFLQSITLYSVSYLSYRNH